MFQIGQKVKVVKTPERSIWRYKGMTGRVAGAVCNSILSLGNSMNWTVEVDMGKEIVTFWGDCLEVIDDKREQ